MGVEAPGRGHGMSGLSDRLGALGIGSAQERTGASGPRRSIVDDLCFVMLIQGSATLRAVAPKFGVSTPLQQPRHPLCVEQTIAAEGPAPTLQASHTCQECGHLYTTRRLSRFAPEGARA